MERNALSASLTGQAVYELGEPVLVTLEIANTGRQTYRLLTWGTPLEGALTADCLVVQRGDEVLRYDGKFVKHGDPPAEAYLTIGAGEKLRAEVDLSTAYPIDRPGRYAVRLDAELLDAFEVAEETRQAARVRADHAPYRLPDATLRFTVIDGAAPRQTEGQAARAASPPQARASAASPSFNGGTAAQQASTITAHENAHHFADRAVDVLDCLPPGGGSLYETWFGTLEQGRYSKVRKHYFDIADTLAFQQVTYDLTRSGCQSGWFAYTYDGVRTVWLCSGYFSAPATGRDSQFGTLVHEWSHAVSGTDDLAYGDTNCLALATNDPDKAVNNADNHEYFAEDLEQSDLAHPERYVLAMEQSGGPAWFARHGLTPEGYQQHFNDFVPQGYRPTIARGYAIDGQERYILAMEQRPGPAWFARHGLTAEGYQQHFDEFVPQGYRPTIAHVHTVDGQERYILAMEQRGGPAWFARHGLTAEAYQQLFDEFVPQGYRPTIAHAYAINGSERYILAMEQRGGPAWFARHGLTAEAYQQLFDEFVPQGYRPTIAHGYTIHCQQRYILAMEQRGGPAWFARHGLTNQGYQQHFNNFVPQGFRPTIAGAMLI